MVRKRLACYDRVRLTETFNDNRLMKAPIHVAKSGELALLALRLAGWDVGEPIANPPRLEPDFMWNW